MAVKLHSHLALVLLAEEVSWEQIRRGSGIAEQVLKELSPRAAIVEPEAVDALVRWLQRNGFMPQVVS